MYTATEDHITVLTVGRRLRQTMICSVMFKFTLVQSCTHVRHCSERFTRLDQLKSHLLKSHNEGTCLTCHICEKKFSHSGDLKTHVHRHEGVKPYVCSDCPKRFCTASEMKSHLLVHSDYKQFCCFLCDEYFKHKASVKQHFVRCAANMTFDNDL